ncbi:hypothetical protein KGP93_25105 [Burkholderia multivorans]|nr:hypothetical protein [Burkholderia multivorans]
MNDFPSKRISFDTVNRRTSDIRDTAKTTFLPTRIVSFIFYHPETAVSHGAIADPTGTSPAFRRFIHAIVLFNFLRNFLPTLSMKMRHFF